MANSKIPQALQASIAALMILIGAGGVFLAGRDATKEAQTNAYIQAVANDPDVSDAIRIAMVMASYYESSNRHIGTPYVDKLGKGQPLTVCNGLTGKEVVAGRYYEPAECYRLERRRYVGYEQSARKLLVHWYSYDPFQQATFLDYLHNKGEGNLITSTMLRKANAGDWLGACRENPHWNRGTVKGVSTVLPGLQLRGDANDEICREWRMGTKP